MPRITCKVPSPGKSVNYALVNLATSFTTLAEAPDFTLPDANNAFPDRDPLDPDRAIRPGEVSFLTPLWVRNKTLVERVLETQLARETGGPITGPRVIVPPNETVSVPFQGRVLVKRNPAGTFGERLQVRADVATALDVWIVGEERLSSEHTSEVED